MNETTLIVGNIIGYILQTIYLSYFMINVKSINNKRILLFILVFFDFISLKYLCRLNYTINFDIFLGIFLYLILKILYKDKARITDFITYVISTLLLGIISILIALTIGMNIYGLIIANLIPIILTFILRHKLPNIDNFYNKFWNRHNNKRMFKSITIRGFSSILTILTFSLAHIWLIYGIFMIRR